VDPFAVVMLVTALFVVFVVASIAAIVLVSAALMQRIERKSLAALAKRLGRGEITADEFSMLAAVQLAELVEANHREDSDS
jgi:uncharacterized membrane protein